MQAGHSCKTLVMFYQITLCHILGGSNLHSHHCKNLKSQFCNTFTPL